MFYCPHCGEDTETLNEGYCSDCSEELQNELDQHNFEYDRWQSLTDQERWEAIKFEIR